jgi:ABC-2 type transport system permease protein
MKELAIAAATLRRTLRERSSIFFLFLFPMLMILILGLAFGGSYTPRVGLVEPSSPLSQRLAASLGRAQGIAIEPVRDERDLLSAVEHGELDAGVILPAEVGEPVRYIVRPGLQGQQVGSIVSAAVDTEAARLRAVAFAQQQAGLSPEQAQAKVDALIAALPPIPVTVTATGSVPSSGNRFGAMAAGQLLLFVFLVAMTSSVALVESRRLGVSRRMLATPTGPGTIVRGEALARLSVSLLQAGVIMVGAALFFQVDWGDPLAAALLVIAFAAVASGFGLLMGTLAPTGETAIGAGLLLALGMGALGGAMMPLEFFSDTMRTAAHVTPHAWAIEGFTTLLAQGGGIAEVSTELVVLTAAAAILFAISGWLLRRRLTN